MTPEEFSERRDDPSALTRYFYLHPWLAAALSGAMLGGLVLVTGVWWVIALGAGLALAFVTGVLWRPGGPAQRLRRYLLRRFPK